MICVVCGRRIRDIIRAEQPAAGFFQIETSGVAGGGMQPPGEAAGEQDGSQEDEGQGSASAAGRGLFFHLRNSFFVLDRFDLFLS